MSQPMAAFEERDLTGRIALITGASRGIGAKLAEMLAGKGAKLILVGRDRAALDATIASIKEKTPTAELDGRTADLAELSQIKSLFESLSSTYPHLDILVNNASVMPGFGQDVSAVSDELELQCFRANTEGYHFVTKYALPMLFRAPQDGFQRTVIFMASSAGYLTEPDPGYGMIAYRATKAAANAQAVGLHQLYVSESDAMAAGIRGDKKLGRVVAVHPGFVQTTLGSDLYVGSSSEQIVDTKKGYGAIPIEEGVDTLFWTIAAQDIAVVSGKTYYLRQVHSF